MFPSGGSPYYSLMNNSTGGSNANKKNASTNIPYQKLTNEPESSSSSWKTSSQPTRSNVEKNSSSPNVTYEKLNDDKSKSFSLSSWFTSKKSK